MIGRISVRNFAVAREVDLEPGPGLNVFTGETGAGKSLVVDAVAFAFGAKRGREIVAQGAERATVVVVADERVVERSVGQAGRSSGRIGGEAATLAELEAFGDATVDIHGQSGQLAILKARHQLAALDEYGELAGRAAETAATARGLRRIERRIAELASDERERERLVEQLRYEVAEIEESAFSPGEDERLRDERSRLGAADLLRAEAERGLEALESGPLAELTDAIGTIRQHDPAAEEIGDLGAVLESAGDDLRRTLRHYRDGIETDPGALAAVDARLDLLARLRRKYGETVAEVLAYGERARARLDDLTGAEASIEVLEAEAASLREELTVRGEALSRDRRAAGARLVAAIAAELDALGMGGASLALGFTCEDEEGGPRVNLPDYEVVGREYEATPTGEPVARRYSEAGFDRIEFLASFNPGEPPRPLGMVASGGETSRFFLALTTVLSGAAAPRVVVFDEVDEGVGGRSGSLVGRALARLAERHQVFVVTHLPQVAAYAARHFVVTKRGDGRSVGTEVREVCDEERIAELASMLGGVSEANLAAARELMAAARKDEG